MTKDNLQNQNSGQSAQLTEKEERAQLVNDYSKVTGTYIHELESKPSFEERRDVLFPLILLCAGALSMLVLLFHALNGG